MTISRVNPGTWGVGDKLTSAQANGLDENGASALDKRSGQTDTLASTISLTGAVTLSGAGRVIESVTIGADANTTYLVTGANRVIRVTTAVTANRAYTFSATDAVDGEQILLQCSSDFAYEITVKDQSSAAIYQLGNLASSDGNWVSLIYVGGWKVCNASGAGGVKVHSQTFTANGSFTAPAGVFYVDLDGWGGGGGGAGGADGTNVDFKGSLAGAGGGGSCRRRERVPVTPGAAYAVTIGAGGVGGGVASGYPQGGGSDGANTLFGTLAVFPGAGGGGTGGPPTVDVPYSDITGGMGGLPIAVNSFFKSRIVMTADSFPLTIHSAPGAGGFGGASATGTRNGNTSSSGNAGGAQGVDGSLSGNKIGGGGGGGGGGGHLYGLAGGAGGAGGNATGATGVAGSAGVAAAANSGGGGGGGGSGGAGPTAGGAGGIGAAGGSGQLTVSWTK